MVASSRLFIEKSSKLLSFFLGDCLADYYYYVNSFSHMKDTIRFDLACLGCRSRSNYQRLAGLPCQCEAESSSYLPLAFLPASVFLSKRNLA